MTLEKVVAVIGLFWGPRINIHFLHTFMSSRRLVCSVGDQIIGHF
jgi:hypothetical protein